MANELSDMMKPMYEGFNQHIEEFAAAFAKKTDLDPTQIEMVVSQEYGLNGFTQRIWFQPKLDPVTR